MIESQQPPAEQGNPYLPAGPPDPLIFEEFEGINTATLRPGVDDKQAAWLDGFMPLARRNLRTMYGVSTALYTTAGILTITCFDFGNIGTTPYMVAFISDGSIVAVNTNTGFARQIAAPGTIQNPSRVNIGFAQYGSKYFIIVCSQLNGYFIWDGTTFFAPGASFLTGTIPLGVSGTAVEIYTGRVWIATGPAITFSAPGSLIDFSSTNGGGNFASTDSFLRVQFTQLKQTNGFLYLVADSSINYISGVQTSGPPGSVVTTFTNQNADPEAGTAWPGTVDVFNRNILFANAFGAQVSYGGAVTKISEMLDGVYNSVPNFGSIVPSAAKAIVFGKKIWILLLPIIDPVSGQQVNKLLMWNGKNWWASEQDVPLMYISFQEINSVLTAWGTNGNAVYQLFARPSIGFVKTAQTKLWDKPGGYQFTKFVTRLWGIVQYYSSLAQTINVSIDTDGGANATAVPVVPNVASSALTWLTASQQIISWFDAAAQLMTWLTGGGNAGYSIFAPDAVAESGVLTGFTVTTNAADVAIVSMMIQDTIAGYRG